MSETKTAEIESVKLFEEMEMEEGARRSDVKKSMNRDEIGKHTESVS